MTNAMRFAAPLTLLLAAPAFAAPVGVPLDQPATVNGVRTVCTGIGSDSRQNPAWNAYPLKVVVVGKDGQYLGDEVLTVSQSGKDVLSVDCMGPWLLFQLPAGAYRLSAVSNGVTVASDAHVPASGQGRIILRFPAQGGAVSNQQMEKLKSGAE